MAHAQAHIGPEPYRVDITAGAHALVADEPPSLGGHDVGPAPFELLLAGLGACTSITLKMYAERKQWDLQRLHVDLNYSRQGDAAHIERVLTLEGDLTEEQRTRLADVAERTPVTLAIKSGVPIATSLA